MKFTLTLILFVIGITAMLSGLAMMSSPDGNLLNLNFSVLKNTPFNDFQFPGLLLFASVGVANIVAVFFQMMEHPLRFKWSMIAGLITLGWIITQYLFIGHFLMLDFIYFIAGLTVVFVAIQQRGKSLI
ncbi:MAG: hypothetical protein RIR96_754 [Bacteroidota bacterium]